MQVNELIAGEVGYLAASIKAVADARVGDTITQKKNPAAEALAGAPPRLCQPPLLLRFHMFFCVSNCCASDSAAAVRLPALAMVLLTALDQVAHSLWRYTRPIWVSCAMQLVQRNVQVCTAEQSGVQSTSHQAFCLLGVP